MKQQKNTRKLLHNGLNDAFALVSDYRYLGHVAIKAPSTSSFVFNHVFKDTFNIPDREGNEKKVSMRRSTGIVSSFFC